MSSSPLPRWLPYVNIVVKWLNRAGLSLGTIQVLEVPGRRSGEPRATPVSPLRVDAEEYVIAGLANANWAQNVRAAGAGRLIHGRTSRDIRLIEIQDAGRRRAVMHAFPTEVPHGVAFFVRAGLTDGPTPDDFAAASDRVAVFRIVDAASDPTKAGLRAE